MDEPFPTMVLEVQDTMTSHPLASTLDTNEATHRTPSNFGLTDLKSLRSQNRTLASTLDKEIEALEIQRAGLQGRHRELLQELNSIQSTIDALHHSIISLQQQRRSLDERQDEINGLVHPIRRCPEEILCSIFQWTQELSEGAEFKTAINLSHVCRHWRNVALHLSALWTTVKLSMKDGPQLAKEIVDHTLGRIQLRPVKLFISGIKSDADGGTNTATTFITALQLCRFQHIVWFGFHLEYASDASILALPEFAYTGRIDHMIILPRQSPHLLTWEYSSVLNNFSGLDHVVLMNCTSGRFGDHPIPHIRNVTFHVLVFSETCAELTLFSNLERLTLKEVYFELETTTDVVLPHLKYLYVEKTPTFPWTRIFTPAIRDLAISPALSIDAGSFINNHPQLDFVSLDLTPGSFNPFRSSLPNLRQLSLSGTFMQVFGNGSVSTVTNPFPRLSSLQLVLPDEFELSEDHIQKVATAFASKLESSPSVDRWIYPGTEIEIVDFKRRLDDAPWRQSQALAQFNQACLPAEKWSSEDIWCVKLTW